MLTTPEWLFQLQKQLTCLSICQSVCPSISLSVHLLWTAIFLSNLLVNLCKDHLHYFMIIFFIILHEDQWKIAVQLKFNQSISLSTPTQWVIYLCYSFNFQLATNQILNSGCLSTKKNYLINLLLQFLNMKDISLSFM